MKRRQNRERLKSGILVLLIILSVIQIGIHWNQSQGFPITFLVKSIFNGNGNDHVDVEQIKDNFFLPENIVVSIDPFSQWILKSNHTYYQDIWNDIRQNYLPEICRLKPVKISPGDAWADLEQMKSIRINFYTRYPNSMLLWFADLKTGSPSFDGIKSMIILPQEDVNTTINTIYVYDESSVYMYLVDIKENMKPKAYYIGLTDEMRSQTDIVPMSAIGEAFPDFADPLHYDTPIYAMDTDVIQSIQSINAEIPETLYLDPESDDLKSIEENILLDQKDSLLAMHDKTENTAVFSDMENVYKLDAHGVLEYKYLTSQQKTDIGDAKSAFIKALSFIELRRNLVGDADIVLKEIKPVDNQFVFSFGYRYDGQDVYISDVERNNYLSAPAITIRASSERVLECRWVLREFRGNSDYQDYNLSFIYMLGKVISSNPALLANEKFQNIMMGYHLFITGDPSEPLRPCWLVKTDQAFYRIPLGERED